MQMDMSPYDKCSCYDKSIVSRTFFVSHVKHLCGHMMDDCRISVIRCYPLQGCLFQNKCITAVVAIHGGC